MVRTATPFEASINWGRYSTIRSKASPSSLIGYAKPFSAASSKLIFASTAAADSLLYDSILLCIILYRNIHNTGRAC